MHKHKPLPEKYAGLFIKYCIHYTTIRTVLSTREKYQNTRNADSISCAIWGGKGNNPEKYRRTPCVFQPDVIKYRQEIHEKNGKGARG